ncbi:MAG: Alkaline phosphatase, partial [uncultured Corynebacteriales bacterium]
AEARPGPNRRRSRGAVPGGRGRSPERRVGGEDAAGRAQGGQAGGQGDRPAVRPVRPGRHRRRRPPLGRADAGRGPGDRAGPDGRGPGPGRRAHRRVRRLGRVRRDRGRDPARRHPAPAGRRADRRLQVQGDQLRVVPGAAGPVPVPGRRLHRVHDRARLRPGRRQHRHHHPGRHRQRGGAGRAGAPARGRVQPARRRAGRRPRPGVLGLHRLRPGQHVEHAERPVPVAAAVRAGATRRRDRLHGHGAVLRHPAVGSGHPVRADEARPVRAAGVGPLEAPGPGQGPGGPVRQADRRGQDQRVLLGRRTRLGAAAGALGHVRAGRVPRGQAGPGRQRQGVLRARQRPAGREHRDLARQARPGHRPPDLLHPLAVRRQEDQGVGRAGGRHRVDGRVAVAPVPGGVRRHAAVLRVHLRAQRLLRRRLPGVPALHRHRPVPDPADDQREGRQLRHRAGAGAGQGHRPALHQLDRRGEPGRPVPAAGRHPLRGRRPRRPRPRHGRRQRGVGQGPDLHHRHRRL